MSTPPAAVVSKMHTKYMSVITNPYCSHLGCHIHAAHVKVITPGGLVRTEVAICPGRRFTGAAW